MAGLSTYLDLFRKLQLHRDIQDFNYLHQVIVSEIPCEISQEDSDIIKGFCRRFTQRLMDKWKDAGRSTKTFMNRKLNRKWLETDIPWPTCSTVDLKALFESSSENVIEDTVFTHAEIPVSSVCAAEVGTSTETVIRKPFEDLGNKQKKRRSSSILDSHTEEELQYYFLSKLKENGKQSLASIIEKLCQNPQYMSEVTKVISNDQTPVTISEDKSLAMYTSLSLSKWKYLTLREFIKNEDFAATFPSYHKLLAAKKRCYPPDESIEITERGVRIRLQALLDHTVERILLDLGPLTSSSEKGFKMIWKWGLDGSSSQSNYKQRWTLETSEYEESSIVMTSVVPLRLVDGKELTVWENPAPCSTYYCRPVNFSFASETTDFIKAADSEMKTEIAELASTRCNNTEISHELHMTMIDGKVVNTVSNVRSQAACPICLATPKEMNNLDILAQKLLREDIYQYGLSPLHMKIRCMECILHISYNMDFKKWSARAGNQALKKAKKECTQQEYREQTGLLIDIVKQGFGTTNDGNTARRFFEDYKRSSRITGIDENLIFRFSVILQVISSEKMVKIEAFRKYCRETAEMYVQLYPWYYMPTSVHRLLIHGADICNHFSILPIGILSEEASEARNKDFRNVREGHTRKIGRIQTNEDIIHGLLISSDPHISKIRPKFFKTGHHELHPETVQLLHIDAVNDDREEEVMALESENVPDPLL